MKTIPFNYELWKAGKGKAVYRNGIEPVNVYFIKEGSRRVMSVLKCGTIVMHRDNGMIHDDSYGPHESDLLLQIEPTYVPLEQKDWIIGGPWWVRLSAHDLTAEMVVSASIDGSVSTKRETPSLKCLFESYLRTNAQRMSDPSIPEDQKWVACRKEAM